VKPEYKILAVAIVGTVIIAGLLVIGFSQDPYETILEEDLGFLTIKIEESEKTYTWGYRYITTVSVNNTNTIKTMFEADKNAKITIKISGLYDSVVNSKSKKIDNVTFYKNETSRDKELLFEREIRLEDWIFNTDLKPMSMGVGSGRQLKIIRGSLDVEMIWDIGGHIIPMDGEYANEQWTINKEVGQ